MEKKEKAAAEKQWKEAVTIAMVVSFYFVVSIALVFANKFVMNKFNFPYPLFMTWVQLIVAEVFVVVGGFVSLKFPIPVFAPLEWNWTVARGIIPLTLVYIGMMAFNNICLQYVEVTFYQVARSLTIIWTIFFTYLMFPEKPIQRTVVVACLVVFSGFVVGSMGEVNFDWKGLIAGVVSSAFVAYYGIAIKKSLPVVNGSEWRLIIYNTTLAIVLFVPVLFAFDEMVLFKNVIIDDTIWKGLIISGVLGYLINIALFMQVSYTSPLTNAISGTAKACVQTLAGWLFFQNPISFMNGLGIITVIAGSAWYSHIKYMAMLEEKTNKPKDVEAPEDEAK